MTQSIRDKDTHLHNQTLRVIQSGLMGDGKWVSVVSEDTLRFTRAIALGNGKFPEYDVIKEEELNTYTPNYFLVEVPTNQSPSERRMEWLLERAVKGGYHIQAFNKAKHVGGFSDLVTYFNEYLLASFSRNLDESTSIEVEGRLTKDGYLVFTKTSTVTQEDFFSYSEEVTVVCDGFVYPYDTQVIINEDGTVSLSKESVREMDEDEWAFAKAQPDSVKFFHESM